MGGTKTTSNQMWFFVVQCFRRVPENLKIWGVGAFLGGFWSYPTWGVILALHLTGVTKLALDGAQLCIYNQCIVQNVRGVVE